MLIATIDTVEWLLSALKVPIQDRQGIIQEFAEILGRRLGEFKLKEINEKIKKISIKE
jgi:hypothetical protein